MPDPPVHVGEELPVRDVRRVQAVNDGGRGVPGEEHHAVDLFSVEEAGNGTVRGEGPVDLYDDGLDIIGFERLHVLVRDDHDPGFAGEEGLRFRGGLDYADGVDPVPVHELEVVGKDYRVLPIVVEHVVADSDDGILPVGYVADELDVPDQSPDVVMALGAGAPHDDAEAVAPFQHHVLGGSPDLQMAVHQAPCIVVSIRAPAPAELIPEFQIRADLLLFDDGLLVEQRVLGNGGPYLHEVYGVVPRGRGEAHVAETRVRIAAEVHESQAVHVAQSIIRDRLDVLRYDELGDGVASMEAGGSDGGHVAGDDHGLKRLAFTEQLFLHGRVFRILRKLHGGQPRPVERLAGYPGYRIRDVQGLEGMAVFERVHAYPAHRVRNVDVGQTAASAEPASVI